MMRTLLGCLWLACVAAVAGAEPPPLLLAERYTATIEPAGFLVSEKFDGVRAHWDGRSLRFRSGHPVPAPAWFTAALPRVALDGELWSGRGRFDELSAIVRRRPPVDAEWRRVRYLVFELPDAPGPFAERAQALQAIVGAAGTPWLQAVEQTTVPDRAALQARLQAVLHAGGEGLMLHRADAPYRTGRSDVLLKLTPAPDAEAVVVAHHPGRGRFAGMLGALELQRPDGVRFRVGSGFTDAQRRAPPPIGATVTYRYRELTPAGRPRFPTFVRVRPEF